MIEVSEQQ